MQKLPLKADISSTSAFPKGVFYLYIFLSARLARTFITNI